MKKEFNYIDEIERDKSIHLCQCAFATLPKVAEVLQEYGIKVGTKTIQAALNAKKVVSSEDSPAQPICYNPNISEQNPVLQVSTTSYEGCDAIRDVFEKRVEKLSQNQTKAAATNIRETTMGEYCELMEKLCDTMPKGVDAGGQYILAPIAMIDENGDFATTTPIEQHCENLATRYVSTEKGIQAREKVGELCKVMNEIKELFKPFSVKASVLMADNGDSVSPAQIDYDMYFTSK